MLELDNVVDRLNISHGRLMETVNYGDIVKAGELEMQREHYDRYMEVRKRIENSGKKQMPITV
jgi:hypothetical protein